MKQDFIWAEKYRPSTIDDCILPVELHKIFTSYLEKKQIPNLLLAGSPGIGKTSVAKALVNQSGSSFLFKNASIEGIDVLRNEITNFASTVSFKGGKKYVILDEADHLTHATQPALRAFIEQFSKNCGFILTCNYKNNIIEPLRSRLITVQFTIPKNEREKLLVKTYKKIEKILQLENVEFDPKVLLEIIENNFPDFRKTILALQQFATKHDNNITSAILSSQAQYSVEQLIPILKDRNFSNMRKWVGENIGSDVSSIFRILYDVAEVHVQKESLPDLIIILAEYQYKASQVSDQEINTAACLTEIMANIKFK